jgi:tetratricopeptide (TPR) repeat protein
VFEPADMEDSYLALKRVPQSKKSHVMSYYRKPIWLSNTFQNIDGLEVNQLEHNTFSNKYGASQIHTTARDLLKYHQALQAGKLLNKDTLKMMYEPIQLLEKKRYVVNGQSNYPAKAAMGWRVANDSSAGRIVFHSGGFRGGRSFLIRNLDKNQVIIVLTNNTETDHRNFSFSMRALNEQSYQLDPISLPRLFANHYLDHGIESAIATYQKYKTANNYTHFDDWDFEEIGNELLEKKDVKAAIALFKLYTEKYPETSYSWSSLANAYEQSGNTSQAIQFYRKAKTLNPDDDDVSAALTLLESQ